jgi:hypothetical protein
MQLSQKVFYFRRLRYSFGCLPCCEYSTLCGLGASRRTGSLHLAAMLFRPPLWSSGRSSRPQIQRSRIRFLALPHSLRSNWSEIGPTEPCDGNWGATWMKKQQLRSRKPRLKSVRTRSADHATSIYPQKLLRTSPTSGGCSVDIVCLRAKCHWVLFETFLLVRLEVQRPERERIKMLIADWIVTYYRERNSVQFAYQLLIRTKNVADSLGLYINGGELLLLLCSRDEVSIDGC